MLRFCLLAKSCCGPAIDVLVLCGQCVCLVHSFQVVLALRSRLLIQVLLQHRLRPLAGGVFIFCQIGNFVSSFIFLSLARVEVAAQIAKLS